MAGASNDSPQPELVSDSVQSGEETESRPKKKGIRERRDVVDDPTLHFEFPRTSKLNMTDRIIISDCHNGDRLIWRGGNLTLPEPVPNSNCENYISSDGFFINEYLLGNVKI